MRTEESAIPMRDGESGAKMELMRDVFGGCGRCTHNIGLAAAEQEPHR